MRSTKRLLLTLQALACGMTFAETFSVTPGQSIQDTIDNAADGDVIVIFGGSYGQELTIDKAVQLTEAVGEDVIISGNVTITGVADAPPFRGFNLGAGTTTLTVEDTTGLAISDVVMGNLVQKGGSVYVSDSTINGSWSTERYQVLNPEFNHGLPPHHPINAGKEQFLADSPCDRAVGFRLTVTGEGCNWANLKQGWLGYSTINGTGFSLSNPEDPGLTRALSLLVANEINTGITTPIQISDANADASVQIYNNHMTSLIARPSPNAGPVAGQGESIRVTADTVTVQNNYSELQVSGNPVFLIQGFGPGGTAPQRGYTAFHLSGDTITVRNNVIKGNVLAINAPGNSVVEYNYADNANHYQFANPQFIDPNLGFPVTGGCIPTYAPSPDGALLNTNTGRKTGENSLEFLKDSGWWAYQGDDADIESLSSPNPLYHDRDESRNNLGPDGGPCFDPEAWTTSKPVVISFDISPQSQVAGQGAEVLLSNGIAISAP